MPQGSSSGRNDALISPIYANEFASQIVNSQVEITKIVDTRRKRNSAEIIVDHDVQALLANWHCRRLVPRSMGVGTASVEPRFCDAQATNFQQWLFGGGAST